MAVMSRPGRQEPFELPMKMGGLVAALISHSAPTADCAFIELGYLRNQPVAAGFGSSHSVLSR
jgi:hypothetical protein